MTVKFTRISNFLGDILSAIIVHVGIAASRLKKNDVEHSSSFSTESLMPAGISFCTSLQRILWKFKLANNLKKRTLCFTVNQHMV